MNKELLISISPYVQKYYINEKFKDLPEDIKETLRAKLAVIAEKSNAIISLGFNESSDVYMEYKYEDLSYMDEIGIELRMKKFQKEEEELLKAIKTWYIIYHTPNGEMLREIVLLQSKGKQKDEIKEILLTKFGKEHETFISVLLEDE
ncbi:MAG: hypothetical protein H9872_07710 [Candidatus Cellulosilyticum pullistercoris]|uniref:Uncharacterized protein n=1 Tax=Candidatus Cellulosilyticum pullistercoris TaxID=2838521 RepID=A0A9E2KDW5_9FIRM|nr:hypothetical protein [Candidatus Cellulosilyticum pullistercoris]